MTDPFRGVLILLVIVFAFAVSTFGQIGLADSMYMIFDRQGKPAALNAILNAMAENDVVFLGEEHDDAVAHAIQAELLRRAVESYSDQRRVTLSLEMFERDVQIVLDEYLRGLITEQHFLASSRPWGNYKTDYRPLIEYAKEKRLDVIAANAPRRYVNMVARNGRDSLTSLSPEAKKWLAPLPFPGPSAAYADKFRKLMAGGGDPAAATRLDQMVYSQALWDATMADSITRYLAKNKNALVVHLNGTFHSEGRLGTVEQLMHYRPGTRALVVTIKSEKEFQRFDSERHKGSGDFVVLTDASQPRTKR